MNDIVPPPDLYGVSAENTRAIWLALHDAAGPATARQIANYTGVSLHVCRAAVARLYKAGHLARIEQWEGRVLPTYAYWVK